MTERTDAERLLAQELERERAEERIRRLERSFDIAPASWERLRPLLSDEHTHGDGMNECAICDEPLTDAASREIEGLRKRIRLLEQELDALTLPKHECDPVAVAQLNDVGGRAHWAGRLVKPIPAYEEETHCMHFVTPLKGEVVFGFVDADFEQLMALCQAVLERPVNPHWLLLKAKEYCANAAREDVRASIVPESDHAPEDNDTGGRSRLKSR